MLRDIVVRPDGPPRPGTDRRARIERRPGGSAANVACWLSHRGVTTRFAGRVGAADVAAETATLAAYGVAALLMGDPVAPTGTVVAILGPAGERSFLTDRGASANLAHLPDTLLDGVRLLHVSGHAVFASPATITSLMHTARAREIAVSLDAGSAGWLAEHGTAAWHEAASLATLHFANAAEDALLGDDPARIVTLGPAGARRGAIAVPAAPATVIDGTGAGDAFVAGALAAWLDGADTRAMLCAGCTLAAHGVATLGGRPPLCEAFPWTPC